MVQTNITRAERDNDLIYHQDVPPISALPAIQEVPMVQSSVPAGLQDPKVALGDDGVIFSDLVGWGARVAVGASFNLYAVLAVQLWHGIMRAIF